MKEQKGRGPVADHLDVNNARVGIVASNFNSFVVDRLLEGALETLREHGIADEHITVVRVPGAFELPLAALELAQKSNCDGIIALGTVIRGETAHFDYVCSGATDGLMRVCLDHAQPLGFGLLAVESEAQAIARAGDEDNKGRDAAMTVLEMISLLRDIRR